MRPAGRRVVVRRARPVGTGQRHFRATPRGGRRPLALCAGGHRGVGNDRSTANAGRTRSFGGSQVKTALPEDVTEFAAVAAKRFARLGGPQAALRAETEDRVRQDARSALADLGAFDLDVRSGSDDLLAAAVLCRAAGATALPYPLVEELLNIDGGRLALVNPEAPRIDHGDLPGEWVAADLDGNRYHPQPGSRTNAKLGPFLVPATLSGPDGSVPVADVNLHLV